VYSNVLRLSLGDIKADRGLSATRPQPTLRIDMANSKDMETDLFIFDLVKKLMIFTSKK